jgi:hypothetical protein
MDVSVSDVYRLNAVELRQACLSRGLDSSGSVRSLRLRLSQHIKANKMQASDHMDPPKVGPFTRTKRGNIAILVVVNGFSKFVFSTRQKGLRPRG